jgi:hypothetical protein
MAQNTPSHNIISDRPSRWGQTSKIKHSSSSRTSSKQPSSVRFTPSITPRQGTTKKSSHYIGTSHSHSSISKYDDVSNIGDSNTKSLAHISFTPSFLHMKKNSIKKIDTISNDALSQDQMKYAEEDDIYNDNQALDIHIPLSIDSVNYNVTNTPYVDDFKQKSVNTNSISHNNGSIVIADNSTSSIQHMEGENNTDLSRKMLFAQSPDAIARRQSVVEHGKYGSISTDITKINMNETMPHSGKSVKGLLSVYKRVIQHTDALQSRFLNFSYDNINASKLHSSNKRDLNDPRNLVKSWIIIQIVNIIPDSNTFNQKQIFTMGNMKITSKINKSGIEVNNNPFICGLAKIVDYLKKDSPAIIGDGSESYYHSELSKDKFVYVLFLKSSLRHMNIDIIQNCCIRIYDCQVIDNTHIPYCSSMPEPLPLLVSTQICELC